MSGDLGFEEDFYHFPIDDNGSLGLHGLESNVVRAEPFCFPFWSLEFGSTLGRECLCGQPQSQCWAPRPLWAAPVSSAAPSSREGEAGLCDSGLGNPHMVSLKLCPTWLFSLLALLCVLLLWSQPGSDSAPGALCPPSESLKHTWWGERLFRGLLSWFVPAAIKKEMNNYRFGSLLTTEIYFSQLWSCEVKDQAAAYSDFLKVLFLVWSWSLLTGPSHAGRDKGSLWVFYDGALIPFMSPSLRMEAPPQGPTY